MIRRVKAALLCVIVAMTVSACGLDAGMTIKDEDTLDFALTVTFTKAELALSGTSGSSCTDLLRESDMDSEGYDEETGYYYRVEDRSSGGDFSCALIFEDISLDEANSRVDPSEQLHISHTGDTWVATFENIYEYQRDFPGMSAVEVLNSTYAGAGDAMQNALDMTVSITMPEPITSVTPSSGATISGNTVVIDTLEVDDEGSLQITAEKTLMSSLFGSGSAGGSVFGRQVAGMPIGLIILILLILVLVIVIVAFAMHRRKKQGSAAQYAPYAPHSQQQVHNPYYPQAVQGYPSAPGLHSASSQVSQGQASQARASQAQIPQGAYPAQPMQSARGGAQAPATAGYMPPSGIPRDATTQSAHVRNPHMPGSYQQQAQPTPGSMSGSTPTSTPASVPGSAPGSAPYPYPYQQPVTAQQLPYGYSPAPSQLPTQSSPAPSSGNESSAGAEPHHA